MDTPTMYIQPIESEADIEVTYKLQPDMGVGSAAGVSGAPASSDAEAAVAALLRQPSDVRDIVASVAAYSTRGTEASTLRVLLSSEVAAPGLRLFVEWGFAVFNEDNVVSTGRLRLEAGSAEPVRRVLMAARNGSSDAVLLNGAEIDTATLPPGRYSASVVALLDSEPVGRVSRQFDVRPAPSSTP